jgi:5-methylcytosine-specific restriction enzyme B
MSRYCGEVDPAPVLKAAAHWKAVALQGKKSVLSADELWTEDNIASLDKHFVRTPDLSDDGLFEKLERQLAPTAASVKRLVAEMFWLLYLCPSSITSQRKRDVIGMVWSWSGESVPDASSWLSDAVLAGIGSAGPGFNQNQWRELTFLIRIVQAFRALDPAKGAELLADPWNFVDWVEKVEGASTRQFRHMLSFLLFPDEFERIFGQRDRKAIAAAFSGRNAQYVSQLGPAGLDRLLKQTREVLENEYGTKELDYYVTPLAERWRRATVASVAADVTREHVKQALEEIDRAGTPPDAASAVYDLIEGSKRYAPKYVLELASGYATGEKLDRASFSGGEESSAFRLLRGLGFHIEPKEAIEKLIGMFLAQSSTGNLSVREYPQTYRGLRIKVSFGKGNVARIPWIAFLADGESVSEGIYPVFLLFREHNVFLLCYGVSEENRPARAWTGIGERKTVKDWFSAKFGRTPDRYGDSLVRAVFDVGRAIDFQDLTFELDNVVAEYQRLANDGPLLDAPNVTLVEDAQALDVRPDLGAAAISFSAALSQAHVSFGAAHDDLVRALLASLTTKPFVILTGLSGSGKTQIALRLGEWLGRLYVAAVRPDWTGAEAVFGYEDGLKRDRVPRRGVRVVSPGSVGLVLR